MTTLELQKWLNAHGQHVVEDGLCGPATRAAIVAAFTNTDAPAVNDADIAALASRLGCTTKQLRAVAKVESGGSAFDKQGRPKILYERHIFHRLTDGRHSVTPYSNRVRGGYGEDSWAKLAKAACLDVDAAFSSISIGRFQVMGMHWRTLGYPSPLEMAYSAVESEAAHFHMLARFIEANSLKDELAALSTNPETNRAFARAYNGLAYEDFAYHRKLADEMR